VSTLFAAALDYAKRGGKVFPCRGKKPLTANGLLDASADEAQVCKWWTANPDANIGMPTGAVNGFWVLDIDKEDGEAWLAEQELEHGPLPSTRTVESRLGHRHLYFSQPAGFFTKTNAEGIARGIDLRGDGGYVVMPPSIHPDTKTTYTVIVNGRAADAPEWLLEHVRRPPAAERRTAPESAPPMTGQTRFEMLLIEMRSTSQGSRNDTLNRIAFWLGQAAALYLIAPEPAIQMLHEAAIASGLPESEVNATIRSGFDAGTEKAPALEFQNDMQNARRFVAVHGPDVRYCAEGWFDWNNARWVPGATGRVLHRMADAVRAMYSESLLIPDEDKRLKFLKLAIASGTRNASGTQSCSAATIPSLS
jgi:hypothetical protein